MRPYFGHLFLFPLFAFLCLLNLKFCIMRNIVNYSKHLYFSPLLFYSTKKFWKCLNRNQMKAVNIEMKSRRPYLGTIGSLVFRLKVDVVIEVNCFLSLYCSFQIWYPYKILLLGVKFSFKNINVDNPNEEFFFTIRLEDDIYTCEHHIWFGL